MLLRASTDISEFGASEIFVVAVVVVILAAGIYTLLKFRKNKNF
jgi:hypothetical protein